MSLVSFLEIFPKQEMGYFESFTESGAIVIVAKGFPIWVQQTQKWGGGEPPPK